MLDIEPLIRDRLAASVPGLAGVHSAVSLGSEDVAGKRLPAAFVVADGYRVIETTGFGRVSRVASRWLVVVAVRNVAAVVDGAAARADVADLVAACMAALMGWQPRPGLQRMQLIDPPAPVYDVGLLLYPVAFEVAAVVQGIEP
jgi:hypothetical protein